MGKNEQKGQFKKNRRDGNCGRCGKERAMQYGTYCYKCYLKRAAHTHLGAASRWAELEAMLLRQRERCAYTGEPLTLGRNASVEHVEPLSRSPFREADITNLKWVSKRVNSAKNNMSFKEFLQMCKSILKQCNYVVTKRRNKR